MKLIIQENSRQIPKIMAYTANKKYHDLIYGLFQELSYTEQLAGESKPTRYVNKKDVNQSRISERLNISRGTVKKYLDNLLELHLIEEVDGKIKRYKIIELDQSAASLIPFETLRKLNNSLSDNAISIFVYLLNRYIANGEQEFIVTNTQLKTFIGVTVNTSSNDHVVTDILEVLSLIGLIDMEIRWEDNKSFRYVTTVRNVLKSA